MQDDSLPDRGTDHHPRPPKRTPELHALGGAIRECRARRGLSQEAFGERAGLHRNYVGAIERGEINPTFRILLQLAAGLDVFLSELIHLYERHRREQPDSRIAATR